MAMNEMCSKVDWQDFQRRAGKAKCYVRMTDSLMSGWGHAENMRNVLYVAVMDMEDVMKLMSWIHRNRPEMKRVDYGFFSWHKDKPPKVVYDRTALVQGCIYNCWLREAGCKEIEGGDDETD